MTHTPIKPWSKCRVLIVNDDGIDAEGLKVLEAFAKTCFQDVMVVAPLHEHSGMAHAISYKKTFSAQKIDDTHYAVEGTPADCTLVGLYHVMKDNPPDLVISGINHGDNAGNAITYSGTFGGAFEAVLAGYRGISFSQLRQEDKSIDFSVSQKYLPLIFNYLANIDWPKHTVMNVNFPAFDNHRIETPHIVAARREDICLGLNVVPNGTDRMDISIRLEQNFEDSGNGLDVDILAQGGVTITPVQTNWTCHDTLKKWKP